MDPAPGAPDEEPGSTGLRALLTVSREQAAETRARADRLFQRHRDSTVVDLAVRLYERDRLSASTVVGSAVAFRLFLFFVPMLLFVVGLLGFLGNAISSDDVGRAGISGRLAVEINAALDQPNSTRWISTLAGLIGMATTGRSLTRVLMQASCLAWQMPVRAKASVRLIGWVVGLLVGLGLSAWIVNRVNASYGAGAASISLLAITAVYGCGWLALCWLLPRPMADPGVLLPGAALVGVVFAGLQAYSQLFLPGQLSRVSELWGTLGAGIIVLGWFFIGGRTIVFSMVVNAVLSERFGSLSKFVFSLPGLSAIARRWPWLRRQFSLDPPEDPPPPPDEGVTL